jgi:hypothetical protein
VVYAPAVFWRALSLLALLYLSQPVGGAAAAEPPRVPAAAPSPTPVSHETGAPLAGEVAALARSVDELRALLGRGTAAPPPWAEKAHEQLLERVERLQTMQERLAARIETPVPRLDEPIVLLTVGGAALVLGFFAGRTVQRRSSRRDRFRL